MRNRKITSMSPGYDSKSLHATLFSAQLIQQKCVLKTTALEKTKEKTNQRKKENEKKETYKKISLTF
jgi:ABC-type Fe3+/spermidine/putrescine transport system ATPase subunit